MSYGGITPKTAPQKTVGGYQGIQAPGAKPAPIPTLQKGASLYDQVKPEETSAKIGRELGDIWRAPSTATQPLTPESYLHSIYGPDGTIAEGGIVGDTYKAWQKAVSDVQLSSGQRGGDQLITMAHAGLDTLSAFFTPVSSVLKEAATVKGPVGVVADTVNRIFASLGVVGGDVVEHMINDNNVLTADQKAKLAPIGKELGALGLQIVAGKVGADTFDVLKTKSTEFIDHINEGYRLADLQNNPNVKAAIDKTMVDRQKAIDKANMPVKPKLTDEQYAQKMGYEGITPDAELPVIQMGSGKRGTFAQKVANETPSIEYGDARATATMERPVGEKIGEKPVAEVVKPEQELMDAYKQAGHGTLSHEKETGIPNENDIHESSMPGFDGEVAKPAEQLAKERFDAQSEAVTSAPKVDRAMNLVKAELELAKPGYIDIPDMAHTHGGMEVHGVASTFPKWLPENARSSKMIQRFLAGLDPNNITYPPARFKAQRAFYDAVWDQVDFHTGIDTSAIRGRIMANEQAPTLDRGNAKTGGSGSGGNGGARGGGGQRERVAETVKDSAKSIRQIAKETAIKEPNVRRILGVGAKDGTFERVEEGIYRLRTGDGRDIAYVESADAVDATQRLIDKGEAFDYVFTDPPYPVTGGGRIQFEKMSATTWTEKMVPNLVKLLRDEDSFLSVMLPTSKSSKVFATKYFDALTGAGLKPVARGNYYKMTKDGGRHVAMGTKKGEKAAPLDPEAIVFFSKSGNIKNLVESELEFKLVRPEQSKLRGGYSTAKPAELVKRMIEMSTNEGDVVLDPFAGSGVVGVEAVKAGRKAYMIEKDALAAEKIKERISKAAGGAPAPKKEVTTVQKNAKVDDIEYVPLDNYGNPKGTKYPAPSPIQPKTVVKTAPRAPQIPKPIEGTGDIKTRGVSASVEASAIEKELTEHFGDLPAYKELKMADQASKALDIVQENPQNALEIAMGRKAPPKDVLPESVFVAVEKIATAEGDVATLRDLANSDLATEATTMGQRIRTYGERDAASIVDAIREVQKAREEALVRRHGDLKRAQSVVVKDVAARQKKIAPTKESWSEFVDRITC